MHTKINKYLTHELNIYLLIVISEEKIVIRDFSKTFLDRSLSYSPFSFSFFPPFMSKLHNIRLCNTRNTKEDAIALCQCTRFFLFSHILPSSNCNGGTHKVILFSVNNYQYYTFWRTFDAIIKFNFLFPNVFQWLSLLNRNLW